MQLLQFSCARAGLARIALLLVSKIALALGLAVAGTQAMAAATTLVPSKFNDGAEVDTQVLGTRIPLILVHGLGGSAEGWDKFLRAYGQNPAWASAFKPYSFAYISSTAEVTADLAAPRSVTELGGALRDRMQAFYDKPATAPDFGFGRKPVVILAHSMGGLVARSMMQEHSFRDGQRGGQKVLNLITLGTAHQGTQLADVGIALGQDLVTEFSGTYFGFLADLTWTNFDSLNMIGGRCNPWLAQLNNYAPATGGTYGRCGSVPAIAQRGHYEKIMAYGASALQQPDPVSTSVGVYQPGSSSSYQLPYSYLISAFGRPYPNDGVVPMVSAQFSGPPLWGRPEAFECDHRYIKGGYEETVVTATATYRDWAFCPASSGATYPSGIPGGYAVAGSILGAPGAIVDTITTAAHTERAFNWIEQAFGSFVQPAGAATDVSAGLFYYRSYPQTQSYLGVKGGSVYYLGPASNNQLLRLGSLSDFVIQAQRAGL